MFRPEFWTLGELADPTGAGESVRNGPVLLGLVTTPAEKPQLQMCTNIYPAEFLYRTKALY